jgi:hypothetical protein
MSIAPLPPQRGVACLSRSLDADYHTPERYRRGMRENQARNSSRVGTGGNGSRARRFGASSCGSERRRMSSKSHLIAKSDK